MNTQPVNRVSLNQKPPPMYIDGNMLNPKFVSFILPYAIIFGIRPELIQTGQESQKGKKVEWFAYKPEVIDIF